MKGKGFISDNCLYHFVIDNKGVPMFQLTWLGKDNKQPTIRLEFNATELRELKKAVDSATGYAHALGEE